MNPDDYDAEVAAHEWAKFVVNEARQHKDKYGTWSIDIETTVNPVWDTEDSEDHFDGQEDLFEV